MSVIRHAGISQLSNTVGLSRCIGDPRRLKLLLLLAAEDVEDTYSDGLLLNILGHVPSESGRQRAGCFPLGDTSEA